MFPELSAPRCAWPHAMNLSLRLLPVAGSLALGAIAHATEGADAHLFIDAVQASKRFCFPKYHLELWDDSEDIRVWHPSNSGDADVAATCTASEDYWLKLRDYFRTPHGGAPKGVAEWKRPRLAVTLEGGGSKSAPFSLGVLAGLHQSGLLPDVDIISSVSGGTYAAYFYFARILDAQNGVTAPGALEPNTWFKDCIPSVYRQRFAESVASTERFCSGKHAHDDRMSNFARDYPYQAHVRFYQDLVHWKGGLERVDKNRSDAASTYSNVAAQLVQHIITAPLHAVMNSVFAMPESSSPSRFAYRAGIERAYAHTLHSWNGASAGHDEPTGGSFTERVYQRSYTMRDLAGLVGSNPCLVERANCRTPLWIVNAAASSGRDLTTWLTTPATDALRTSFEMSPFGQGSGIYGFLKQPVVMQLRDVVGSSAAFLDRDQRDFGLGVLRFAAGAGISLFNLEWGSDIPNFNTGERARSFARVTPFPLYHISSPRQRFSPTIHLADGGNTDNLGVLAALRRGATNIIVVAATGDGTGRMKSLCRAKNHLELDGTYRVSVPELVDLDHVCSEQIGDREQTVWGDPAISQLICVRRKISGLCTEIDGKSHWIPGRKGTMGYDMWNWPIPILQGTVVRDAADGLGERVIANIYLVKPAIHQPTALLQVSQKEPRSAPGKLCDLDYSYQINHCTSVTGSRLIGKDIEAPVAMPCTALAFAAANACREGTTHGAFPQHDVVFTTLNSSYTLFSAYYDLGRHMAAQVGWAPDGSTLIVPSSLGERSISPTVRRTAETSSVSLAVTSR